MKNVFLFLLGSLCFGTIYGQDLVFSYDAAGNQIYRGPNTQSSSTTQKILTTKTSEEIEEQTLAQEELIAISAAPNPTASIINLYWKNLADQFFTDMTLHTYSNQALLSTSLRRSTSQFQIDLSRYPQGIYIAVFTTNTGFKQSYKIIKK